MGEKIETLADLLRLHLVAACVCFNPSPSSVRECHYYQGKVGQEFFRRLRRIGLLPEQLDGYEDDFLFERGIGFTDIVKRPTWSASKIRPEEYEHGRPLLRDKLKRTAPQVVIFTLERAAPKFFDEREVGRGFVAERIGKSEVFVMPWKEGVEEALADLRAWFQRAGLIADDAPTEADIV